MRTESAPERRRDSLFRRTFLLIAALILVNLAAWFLSVRLAERAPRAQQIALQIASAVNLTRAALVSAQPERRTALLADLARDENIRVDVLEPGDRIEPLPPGGLQTEVAQQLKLLLGRSTVVAAAVNEEPAFWVSFDIDGDDYWLMIDRDRIERQAGPAWALWVLLALVLALAGALATSRLVNRPLSDLADAIRRLSRGSAPRRLSEHGPAEIARINRRFNRLADALQALESDRALALAGISHDLRTPLARLRLELEMAGVDEATRQSMTEDIEAIDRIVGQFVEFARGGASGDPEPVDVDAVLRRLVARWQPGVDNGELRWEALPAAPGLTWRGRATDLERILDNLVQNAVRYGHAPDEPARTWLAVQPMAGGIRVVVRDHGPGVPAEALERLPRPFARLDTARGAASGSGLGLAIVERLAARHDGALRLGLPEDGGLSVEVDLPHAPA